MSETARRERTGKWELCCALVVAALWIAPAAATETTACVDRLASTPDSIDAAQPRLPELSYECLQLDSGQSLWVGETPASGLSTVLLVHGLGDLAHRDWRNVIPALVSRYHVVTVDLPGFGTSPAPAAPFTFDSLAAMLDETLRRKAVNRAHVVGHSLGAALSLHFAYQYPDRVDRLVLVDAAGILQKSVFVRYLTELNVDERGAGSAIKKPVNFLSRILRRKLESKFDFAAWLVKHPSVRSSLLGQRTQLDAGLALVEQNFAPVIRATNAPVTLIWGRDDAIAPLRTGYLLAGSLPDARLHILDGVGHVPMKESAESFNALLATALAAPLAARFDTAPAPASYGDVVCKSKPNQFYTGHFRSLRLSNCADARIENAVVGRLVIKESTVEMMNVSVASKATAMTVAGSLVTGTNISLKGVIAIKANSSELDLACATLRATRRAVHMSSGRLYFSVSDIQSPEYRGDAHFIWQAGYRGNTGR